MDPFIFPYTDIPMDSTNHYAYSFDAEMIDNTDLHADITHFSMNTDILYFLMC